MWLFIEPLAMLKRIWPPPAPRSLRADQRQIDRVGHEVGDEQKTLLLALGAEVVGLAVEAVLEVVLSIEHELDVPVEIDHQRRIGDGDVARRHLAGAVEVLVSSWYCR
jgi:hypothetical protein